MITQTRQEILDQYEVSLRLTRGDAVPATLRAELRAASRLILTGTGASLLACKVAQYAFIKYARTLPTVAPAGEIDLLLPAMEPGTLVILVSQSGESVETKTAVHSLQAGGTRFWGVTNNPNSYLARHAARVLLMQAGPEVSSATKTYMATLLLLFMLAGAPVTGIPADVQETIAAADGAVDRWAAELKESRVMYVLGMGILGPTAAQGGLLLKEKTGISVEGMSLSEFRHGHVEVVHAGLPILVVAATPADCAQATKHAEYLESLGARVYLITDTPITSQAIPPERLLTVPNCGDEVTGQIPVVIPLQMLSERIALFLGRNVDGFHYIAKVVDTYDL